MAQHPRFNTAIPLLHAIPALLDVQRSSPQQHYMLKRKLLCHERSPSRINQLS